jgi:peptidoglycan DL-endopeptidase CwlO
MHRLVSDTKRRRRLAASVGGVATLAALAIGGQAAAPAQDLHSQLQQKKAKLSHARAREGVLSSTIRHENERLQQLEGQVASLRNEIAVARVQLRRVEAELARDRIHLKVLRQRLHRSLGVLSERLVSIYKSDQPDALTVILNAHGFDDLATRYDYLKRIERQDATLVDRVRGLRNEARATVRRVKGERDRIAARKIELHRTEQALAARQSQLAAAQAQHQNTLSDVKQNAQVLEGSVADIQQKIAAQIAAAQAAQATTSAPTAPAGPVPGQVSSQGMIWPVNGPVTSPFCEQRPWESCHPGIDIGVPSGTPVRAAAAGTVILVQSEAESGGYGNYICIDHGGGLSTCYAHLESFSVSSGQRVSQGQVIGLSDCTGLCFGPHLHFEVRVNGQVTDPMAYLP